MSNNSSLSQSLEMVVAPNQVESLLPILYNHMAVRVFAVPLMVAKYIFFTKYSLNKRHESYSRLINEVVWTWDFANVQIMRVCMIGDGCA